MKNSKNTLDQCYPEIASEWDFNKNNGLTPDMVTATSGRKVWWQCEKGHEWEALISNRTRAKSGCPYCAGKKAIVGVNDLATANPQLASEWHPIKNGSLTPSDVMSSSKKKIGGFAVKNMSGMPLLIPEIKVMDVHIVLVEEQLKERMIWHHIVPILLNYGIRQRMAIRT